MPEVMQYPQAPDEMARLAGRDIYDTSVGVLRRTELYRLGNAWGFDFPVGATKDYMLPFFKELEAKGKNPLRPPTSESLDTLVRRREVTHSDENHSEMANDSDKYEPLQKAPSVIEPEPKTDFELKLDKIQHGQLKKICKLRGIPQSNKDRKQDLIARIVATAAGGNFNEQDLP